MAPALIAGGRRGIRAPEKFSKSTIERRLNRRCQRIPASLANPRIEDREERIPIEADPLRLHLGGALETALGAPEHADPLSDILRSSHRAAPAQAFDYAPLIALMEAEAPLLRAELRAGFADPRESLIDALERLLGAEPVAEVDFSDHPGPACDGAKNLFKA